MTKDDLDILKGELESLEGAIYQSKDKYNEIIRSDIRSWVSEIVHKESAGKDVTKYIKELKNEIETVPVLSACIGFEPSSSFIESVSGWLKKNVDDKLVVDIVLNTMLLGGVQLSYAGKYLDLSLRKKISKELENVNFSKS